jgi:hypothetical protein
VAKQTIEEEAEEEEEITSLHCPALTAVKLWFKKVSELPWCLFYELFLVAKVAITYRRKLCFFFFFGGGFLMIF